MSKLKLFKIRRDPTDPTMPIDLQSTLPSYVRNIFKEITGILEGLGYEVIEGAKATRNNRFGTRKFRFDSYGWCSRTLDIYYGDNSLDFNLSIESSDKRKDEAFKIAEEIESKVTEIAKDYVEQINSEHFTADAQKAIPTLIDAES